MATLGGQKVTAVTSIALKVTLFKVTCYLLWRIFTGHATTPPENTNKKKTGPRSSLIGAGWSCFVKKPSFKISFCSKSCRYSFLISP
jgi:hypothetical protein